MRFLWFMRIVHTVVKWGKMVFTSFPISVSLLIAALFFFYLYKKIFKTYKIRPKPAAYKKDFEKDKVYLYQFKRTKKCPNLSPFCMKIEVILRAYNIPYEICDEKRRWSRNGQMPFIELNGEHIADSDLIEHRLRKHFGIPSLPGIQESHSIALTRLVDNHLFNLLIRYKSSSVEFYQTILELIKIPSFLRPLLMPLVRAVFTKKIYLKSKMAVGDFEQQDLDDNLNRDLQVIQSYLGDQKFLFGDKITPVDASVFGHLASVYYPFRCSIADILEKDFPKILEYMERVRQEIYPNDFTI